MTLDPLFVAGLAVLALLTISPGADMALVADRVKTKLAG